MHYHAEIYLESLDNLNEQLEKIMKPYNENLEVEKVTNEDGYTYWDNPKSFWDWWQIGGRWTGIHDDYDPEKDPENIEVCYICGGTGKRMDKLGVIERIKNPSYTCNGCGHYVLETETWAHGEYGPGKCLKWPTNWKQYKGDIIPVSKIKKDLECYTLIVKENVYHKKEWNGEDFIKTDFDGNVSKRLNELGIKEGYLITIDYHC